MARRIRWQILIAVISAGLVLALMSSLAVSKTTIQRPVEGGDYIEGLLYTPQQINPLIGDVSNDQGAADIQALIFDGLVRMGPTGQPEPALAQSWQVDQTGTVYTFFLRDGLRWHDGQPVTVDDLLFTIHTMQGPAFTGNPSYASIWRNIIVDQLDSRTIQCRLNAPFAAFLEFAVFPILPAHLLQNIAPERWAGSDFARVPIGTGPYRISELSGTRALLRANENYYRGRPFIDTIELRYYQSAQTAMSDLIRGTIQGLSYTSISELRDTSLPKTITRHSAPLDGYTTLTFNLREAPLNDIGLRRALATGLDRNGLINSVLGGQARVLDTPILPQWWFAAPEVGLPAYSQERAAGLLDQLGYTRNADGSRSRAGKPLSLSISTDTAPDRLAAAAEIARQWGQLGIKVEVVQLEPAELQQRLASHQFTIAIHAWQRLGGDPDIYELWHSDQASNGHNYAGLQDQQLDGLIDAARSSAEQDTRAAAYAAFQRRWVELTPGIPLYQPLLFYATSTTLGGVDIDTPDPDHGQPLLIGRESRFRGMLRWFLRSAREIRGDLR